MVVELQAKKAASQRMQFNTLYQHFVSTFVRVTCTTGYSKEASV